MPRWFWRVGFWLGWRVALAYVLLALPINAAVRYFGGGTPHWLSPLDLRAKATALGHLARHLTYYHVEHDSDLAPLVRQEALRQGVPPAFALAVAHSESGFAPHAISHAGAMGVMQLMPGTAREMGVNDAFNPAESAAGGTRYLARLWRRYRGDPARVAAAYNVGPGAVPVWGEPDLPGETRRYVAAVVGRYAFERRRAERERPKSAARIAARDCGRDRPRRMATKPAPRPPRPSRPPQAS